MVQAKAEREGEDTPGHAWDERDTALEQEGEDEGQTGRDRCSSSHRDTGERGKGAIYPVRLCTTMDQVREVLFRLLIQIVFSLSY
jgi:hypothetical protein